MEKNRNLKIISIIGLCLGIASLAIGFANYSSMLSIKSGASVGTSGGTFKVEFSSLAASESTTNITIDNPNGLENVKTPVINNTNNDPEISNLGATFTQPNQSVSYTFYARNVGEYTAFLNSVTYTGDKTCDAINGTSEEVKTTLCEGLSLSITVGEGSGLLSFPTTLAYGSNINEHSLAIGGSEKIVVTISYNPTTSLVGDISATFGTIALNYNGVD
jgi:hypothetical protein